MFPRFLFVVFCASSFAWAEATPSSLLAAAQELLTQVAPENTSYKHKEPVVRWSTDPANPAWCHTDCSGLIIALLEHNDPQFDGDAFKRWLNARRPTARRFYDAIAEGKGFQRIEKISDVQPGDIIAMKYQPGGENTGHTMLVAGAPHQIAAVEPLSEGTTQWLVTIIDETGSGHGPNDTRRLEGGKFRSGLGQGEFRLYAHPDGTLAGYAWSAHPRSQFYGADGDRVVAVGRLQKDFRP